MNCPKCGAADAYVGFFTVECQNSDCPNYKPLAATAGQPDPSNPKEASSQASGGNPGASSFFFRHPAFAANQHNLLMANTSSGAILQLMEASGVYAVTGLRTDPPPISGQYAILANIGAHDIALMEDDQRSDPDNRMVTSAGSGIWLPSEKYVTLVYGSQNLKWFVTGVPTSMIKVGPGDYVVAALAHLGPMRFQV